MSAPLPRVEGEMSLFAVATLLLRHRWRIAFWTVLCAAIAAASVIRRPAEYLASASFAPQGNDPSRSGLASFAGQFGVSLPSGSQTLSPEYYARLLTSRTLLRSIVLDTLVVQEEGGRRVAFMELFEVEGANQAVREDRAVKLLYRTVETSVSKPTGIVDVAIRTKWRSVSVALVDHLVTGVNEFNERSRQSQAGTERRFVEGRMAVANTELRAAEERLGGFLRSNRQFDNSPDLALTRDRLQRDVSQRQAVYTTLAQSYEEARIREVRDTPVITVIESPSAPALPEPRGRLRVGLLGIMVGGFLGAFIVLATETVTRRRAAGDAEVTEFVSALEATRSGVVTQLRRATGRQPQP